ncbi:MAG: UDP-N-acetylmuramoyl-L-alanyl-D-glutamate--2,6-diaminopimelate ligase [Nitrospinae bacterium]|nr:UDP-N-acetylmuramoyl-L-alanyl-D-glutamate--2,6-diaminopimelate ligase [Nitrospinota bacterium]
MQLEIILKNIEVVESRNYRNIEINELVYKPDDIKNNALYFCIDEFVYHDGKVYDSGELLSQHKGEKPVSVLYEKELRDFNPEIVYIKVKDSRKTMAIIAANFFHNPEKQLTLIGVTGTNGKTTTARLLQHIFNQSGYKTAVLGTLGCNWPNFSAPLGFTTPFSPELFALFKKMVDDKVTHCVMEVSSHALKLDRVYGLDFSFRVFTNLTRDHIDFHGDFKDYQNSKLILFKGSNKKTTAVCNEDDVFTPEIKKVFDGNFVSYGFSSSALCRAACYKTENFESKVQLHYKGKAFEIKSRLLARFNVSNIMAAFCVAMEIGIKREKIIEAIFAFETVPGRFEKVVAPEDYLVVIDYAHTPDALENIVTSCRELTSHKLITVFGCGGDRDRGKRRLMGDIALKFSDFTVVTSDNPRTENPEQIVGDIVENYPQEKNKYTVIVDRREAICFALNMAQKGDIVILAGKGHEDYQIIGREKVHFSDKEEVEIFFRNRKK